jgi:hypothetical protein
VGDFRCRLEDKSKRVVTNWEVCELDLYFSGCDSAEGTYVHGNELAGCLKGGKYFDRLSYYRFVRKQPPPYT